MPDNKEKQAKTANFQTYRRANGNYSIRTAQYDNRSHIVVPVVIMVEGVHNGSQGAILHTAAELSNMTQAWNGIPVTIGHPKQDENYISANSPDVPNVGRIFNARWENNKLRAEAWLDEQKLLAQSPEAISYIRQGRALDVSMGAFNEYQMVDGEWNGEQYIAIASNYRPDHLALLPGEQGACSWADGCGIRNNQNINNNDMEKTKEYPINNYLEANEAGMMERLDALRRKVDSMDSQESTHWLEEVYAGSVIYRKARRESSQPVTHYKQSYTVETDNQIEWSGEPTKVRKEVDYLEINSNINQKTENMSTKKKTCGCPDKVQALIANERTRLTEQDKEWLSTMTNEQLDRLEPETNKEEKPAEMTDEAVTSYLAGKDLDAVVKLLPTDLQANVTSALALRTKRRDAMITAITTHAAETWKKEDLEALSCDMLEKIHKTIPNNPDIADYSAASGGTAPEVEANKASGEPLYPLGVQ